MTNRLPVPGSDDGNWDDILNDFLEQAHNSDGSLAPDALTAAGAYSKPAGGIPQSDLDSATQTKINTTSGTIADGSIVKAKLETPVRAG